MKMSNESRRQWLEALLPLARRAGEAILAVYATDFAVKGKADASPVTLADELAEEIILAGLAALMPHIPVVSEERAAATGLPAKAGECFWLVDPLDGTKEFIKRNGEFTVNIALVEGGRPSLGVVLAPAQGRLFAGGPGLGSFQEDAGGRRPLRCRAVLAAGLSVVASRSHGDGAELDAPRGYRVAECLSVGSSLKFCLLAAGEADFYPRHGRTMEWDTAAGHGVLLGAGGRVSDLTGAALAYGKPGFENPAFLAYGLL